jgi:hypothetical protein
MATWHAAGIWPCDRFSQNPIKHTGTHPDAAAGVISQANLERNESLKVDCTSNSISTFYEKYF